MSEEKKNEVQEQEAPTLTMQAGNMTLVIGMHFSTTGKETMEDKVHRMMRETVRTEGANA